MSDENPYAPPRSVLEGELPELTASRKVGRLRYAAKAFMGCGGWLYFAVMMAGMPKSNGTRTALDFTAVVLCLVGTGLRYKAWRAKRRLLKEGQWDDPAENQTFYSLVEKYDKFIWRAMFALTILSVVTRMGLETLSLFKY